MCSSIHDIFLLVLSISCNSTPETIHKSRQITKAFAWKRLEFLPGRWNQSFIIQLLLVLLPAETDAVLEKRCSKKYVVRSFCSGSSKMVLILLTEVVTGHIVITPLNIRQPYLEEAFSRAFCSHGFGFHHSLNDILHLCI